jgi:hypothetical protein
MSTVQQKLIPVSETYGNSDGVSAEEASQRFGRLDPPPGWSLDSTTSVPLTIGFADGDDPLAASGVTNDSATSRVSVVAERRVDAGRFVFSHGSETLEVEVVPTRDPLVAVWSQAILGRGPSRVIGMGRGFSSGETTVIDAGDRLVRGTYGDSSADAIQSAGTAGWRDRASARALELVGQLRSG